MTKKHLKNKKLFRFNTQKKLKTFSDNGANVVEPPKAQRTIEATKMSASIDGMVGLYSVSKRSIHIV